MIVVQDKELRIIFLCASLTLFLVEWNDRGASIGSYDYLRKKVKDAGEGNPIKYKMFLITRMEPIRGTKTKVETTQDKFLKPIM